MRSLVMKEAWAIAQRSANLFGGKKSEWLAYGLVRAWKKAKEGKLVQASAQESKPILRGTMTSKQENFISSLLRKKEGKYEEDTLIKAFKTNVRDNISKAQASRLIEMLLNC